MSTVVWTGAAAGVAQVDTLTVGGTVEAGDLFIMTINGKSLSVAATTTVLATTATDIVTAWNACTYPEFAEITAAATSGGALTLTADTAGVPFTCTVSTTESNGGAADAQTFGTSATTAATGKNFWSNAKNWSTGSVPVSTDTVYIENSAVPILYGLAQSAVTLTALHIAQTYTGTIGLPATNSGGYPEYRAQTLAISATTLNIGKGDNGAGSGRINLDLGSAQAAINVYNSGTPAESNRKAINIVGTHASNTLTVLKGSVGIASAAAEVATILTMTVGGTRSGTLDVLIGSGVTLTTANVSGGNVTIDCAATTITQTGGTVSKLSGATTTLTVDQGICYYKGTGTITNLKVSDGATADFSQDIRARTVTNCNLYNGAKLLDPYATVTFSNGLILNRAAISEVTIDVGVNRTLTPS